MKQLFALVFVVCLGVLTTSPALAEPADWVQPEALICSLEHGPGSEFVFDSPQELFFLELKQDSLFLPHPQSWYPPPTECIQGLACSIPRDCPGGQCYLFGIYHPLDRRCICSLLP